jgi:hypothetical protein
MVKTIELLDSSYKARYLMLKEAYTEWAIYSYRID